MFGNAPRNRSVQNHTLERLARFISVVGHPFLLMPVLTAIVAYQLLPASEALIVELIALGVVIVPAGIYTLIRVRRGTWNDLDVSDQRQRGQFYTVLLPLLLVVAVLSWMSDVPHAIPLGALGIVSLVTAAFVLNRWVKVSLHTGFGIFAAETLMLFRPSWALGIFVLAILVGWSRFALGRHSLAEVLFGGLLGGVVGVVCAVSIYLFK